MSSKHKVSANVSAKVTASLHRAEELTAECKQIKAAIASQSKIIADLASKAMAGNAKHRAEIMAEIAMKEAFVNNMNNFYDKAALDLISELEAAKSARAGAEAAEVGAQNAYQGAAEHHEEAALAAEAAAAAATRALNTETRVAMQGTDAMNNLGEEAGRLDDALSSRAEDLGEEINKKGGAVISQIVHEQKVFNDRAFQVREDAKELRKIAKSLAEGTAAVLASKELAARRQSKDKHVETASELEDQMAELDRQKAVVAGKHQKELKKQLKSQKAIRELEGKGITSKAAAEGGQ